MSDTSNYATQNVSNPNTRKVGELGAYNFCTSVDHYPPSYIVYDPGVWEHTCPSCQKVIRFNVFPKTKGI